MNHMQSKFKREKKMKRGGTGRSVCVWGRGGVVEKNEEKEKRRNLRHPHPHQNRRRRS